jgi:hypothetical protein
MLWHIVRFRSPHDVDPDARHALEADLGSLDEHIDEIAWLAVARDLDDARVTGLLSGFADEAALDVYREHPAHLPVVARARELCDDIQRLDVHASVPPRDSRGH